MNTTDRSRVKYTKYVIGNILGNASGSVQSLKNNVSNISGILKCGQTILMPVGIRYSKVRCVFYIYTLDATQLILLFLFLDNSNTKKSTSVRK
jgi:hypothetical protein